MKEGHEMFRIKGEGSLKKKKAQGGRDEHEMQKKSRENIVIRSRWKITERINYREA